MANKTGHNVNNYYTYKHHLYCRTTAGLKDTAIAQLLDIIKIPGYKFLQRHCAFYVARLQGVRGEGGGKAGDWEESGSVDLVA